MKILCVTIALVAVILPNGMVEGACEPITLVNASGVIVYPSGAVKGDKCLFTIKVKDMAPNFVTLMMSSIVLSNGGELKIYDGDIKTETQLYSFSGSNLPQQIGITFSNNVNLQYTVGDEKPKSNWDISYTSNECKLNVTNTWVEKIDSPKHLPTKEKGFNCKYTVVSDLPVGRIQVVSMQLELKDKCSLELTNGQSTQIYTDKTPAEDFFGTDPSSPIEAIYKVTDASTKPTFSLVVDPLIQECSGKYILNETMPIVVSIPADHAAQYNCRSLFVAKTDTDKILAKLTSLTIVGPSDILRFMDTSSSSKTDSVQTALTATSNSLAPDYLFATSSKSLIVTLSLGNGGGKRKVEFSLSPQENGGRFTGAGTLTAGNSKEDADTTISAYFQLMATPDKVVSTEVLTSLPENATLSFYDGLQTSDKLLIVFDSKTASTETVEVIGGSEMLLVLEKFPSTKNFTATFNSIEPGCNKLLTDASGELTFSNQESFNGTQNCTLTIDPYNAVGDTLVLNFDSLTIGDKESVLIYSGDDVVAEFNAKNSQASEVYVSGSTKAMILVMNGGKEKTRTSMTGRYSVKANVCGGNLALKSGDILTPNFPNQYPLNADCVWFVSSDEGESVAASNKFLHLTFKSINLAPEHSIKVSDMNNGSSEELACYMGTDLPDDFIVPVATGLNVEFSSMAKDAGMKNQVAGGADISYMILSCGGNMSSGKGAFSSPGYPNVTTESATCVWIIEVAEPDPTKNGTNIVSMNITLKDTSAKTLPGSLMIYDGPSVRSPILSVANITKGKSGQVLSRYKTVVIKYNYVFDSKTKDKAGFTLEFDTYKCNSSQLCDNGVCLHPDWKCNGVDDCGDNTDEKGCGFTPSPVTPTPKPSGKGDTSGYVKGGYVALLFFIALILGAVLVLVVPKIIRKVRGGGRSYSRMHDSAPVVT